MEQPPKLYGNGAAGWGYRLEREGLSSSGQGDMENQQQQQQQQVCSWERFLQKKTIRVLLVENDDSTRHVVTALLGHCMYQVIPAENGQQAWTYLEDMQNNIDLVLAEVFMPGVSGISLLSRIMSHNVCKNIPVIMMSSNDAMGTVFKCLSKGAVDFLVKPIRKNELKNLWQHVWRRCHSSSGSGSESGTRTQKGTKSKSVDGSDNNSGSNDDDASIELNARDGSDNGSGTQAQSSWTKRAVEIDSPQAMSPDQLADPPDSTCAQVTHQKSDGANRWLPGTNNGSCKKQKEINDDFKRNLNMDHQSSPNARSIKPADRRSVENHLKEKMMEKLEEPTVGAADLIGSMAKNMDAQQAARDPNCSSKVAEGKDKNHDNVLPSLELSLKRLRSPRDGANAVQDEQRNVLRRSDPSAFTRYHTNQGGTGFVGSCSPHDNSGSEAMKADSAYNMKRNSDAAPIEQGSNGSSNNNDMGSTTKSVVTNNKESVMSPSAIKANTAHTSAFHPVQHWTLPAGEAKADEVANSAVKNQCGSSNVFDPALEGQAANYGANGSNSGSYNGTNGQNASAEGTATETAMGQSGPGGSNGSGSGSGNDTYVKRFAPAITLRETQLSKYREKRKDRNFGKKVRYQSRKRLAEQRPRVRGQFVKQQAAQGGLEGR